MVKAFIFFTSVRRGYSGGSLAQRATVCLRQIAPGSFPRRHLCSSKNHAKITKEEGKGKKEESKREFSVFSCFFPSFFPFSLFIFLLFCVKMTQLLIFGL